MSFIDALNKISYKTFKIMASPLSGSTSWETKYESFLSNLTLEVFFGPLTLYLAVSLHTWVDVIFCENKGNYLSADHKLLFVTGHLLQDRNIFYATSSIFDMKNNPVLAIIIDYWKKLRHHDFFVPDYRLTIVLRWYYTQSTATLNRI